MEYEILTVISSVANSYCFLVGQLGPMISFVQLIIFLTSKFDIFSACSWISDFINLTYIETELITNLCTPSQVVAMAPAVEAVEKKTSSAPIKAPALNERILSSMSRRSIAAHPWHDLEIGTWHFILTNHQFSIFSLITYL